jgi:hypothetical protein
MSYRNVPTIYHVGPPNGKMIARKPQLKAIGFPISWKPIKLSSIVLPSFMSGLGRNCFQAMGKIEGWNTELLSASLKAQLSACSSLF